MKTFYSRFIFTGLSIEVPRKTESGTCYECDEVSVLSGISLEGNDVKDDVDEKDYQQQYRRNTSPKAAAETTSTKNRDPNSSLTKIHSGDEKCIVAATGTPRQGNEWDNLLSQWETILPISKKEFACSQNRASTTLTTSSFAASNPALFQTNASRSDHRRHTLAAPHASSPRPPHSSHQRRSLAVPVGTTRAPSIVSSHRKTRPGAATPTLSKTRPTPPSTPQSARRRATIQPVVGPAVNNATRKRSTLPVAWNAKQQRSATSSSASSSSKWAAMSAGLSSVRALQHSKTMAATTTTTTTVTTTSDCSHNSTTKTPYTSAVMPPPLPPSPAIHSSSMPESSCYKSATSSSSVDVPGNNMGASTAAACSAPTTSSTVLAVVEVLAPPLYPNKSAIITNNKSSRNVNDSNKPEFTERVILDHNQVQNSASQRALLSAKDRTYLWQNLVQQWSTIRSIGTP